MLRHYVRQALRVLRKQRLYAVINVLGLSVALGVTVLIALFVHDEFTFDDWHEHADRIVRVDNVDLNPDGSVDEASPSHPFQLGVRIKEEHPDIEETVRFSDADVVIRIAGVMHQEEAMFADDTFFDVFTYVPVQGAIDTALDDPASMVLTETAAKRLFGRVDIVGTPVEVRFENTYEPATVSAVVADPPSSTNLPFGVMMPFKRTPMVYPWIANRVDRWNASSFPVYALLREGADLEQARATAGRVWKTLYPDQADQGRESGWWTGEGEPGTLDLTPIRDLHLRSDLRTRFVATSDPRYSYILMGIALLTIVLACINFTLIAIGQGASRSGEIGVRKALGAGRKQIVAQFGGEAVLMAAFGLVGGLALASVFRPAAEVLSGKELDLGLLATPVLMAVLGGVALITGLAAGAYPSLVVSRNKPADALRGRFSLSGTGHLTRFLLVVQFAGSVALVVGSLAMKAQLDYLASRDKGYVGSNVLVVAMRGVDEFAVRDHMRSTLEPRPEIGAVAGISLSMNRGYSSVGWMADGVERRAYEYNVDTYVLDLLQMEVVAGRMFDALRSTDSSGVMVNEAFAEDWGWTPEEAVGQVVADYGDEPPTIIGVLRNSNLRSQHEGIEPTMFTMADNWLGYLLVRAEPGSTAQAIASTESAWQAFNPDIPFSYTFLDDDVARAYENDLRWARIVRFSAFIAILVACLGLFGLAALTVSRRTKEIGIRKVLGASVSNLAYLISRDFAVLVVVATLLAAPLAWYGLGRWLETFAYRIDLSVWMFVGAGAVVLAVAMGTVAFHALRAAISDPVKSLRYE